MYSPDHGQRRTCLQETSGKNFPRIAVKLGKHLVHSSGITDRIQARAIRRTGELLLQIPAATGMRPAPGVRCTKLAPAFLMR